MKRNFLLGKGERLTESITVRGGGGPKDAPYTFSEAKGRLAPRLATATIAIDALPREACPDDQAVISLTLNPEYIAKSYYPLELLRSVGVTPVGSRPTRIKPEKRSKGRAPKETITTEIFVAGSRTAFRQWSSELPQWREIHAGGRDLLAIEDISAPEPKEKIKGALPPEGQSVFEVVLHADALGGESAILPQFREYLRGFGVDASLDRRFYAGGLCFIELDAPTDLAGEIATFTIVRAVREMPHLRVLRPTIRSSAIPAQMPRLPTAAALDPSIRVAIFDGGLPNKHPLTAWSTPLKGDGVGAPHKELFKHGTSVTSAFLFGHIDPKKPLPTPYANVDHYRVLDAEPGEDPHELFAVLDRIDRVLSDNKYDFINLSLGPRLPIEDDDVHAWTAVLDDRLARLDTLATIAVGNDGEGDAILRLNRIQVPSDCVNALAVGACDTPDKVWQRASYSSIGPGRSPGLVKPDLVEFGGSLERPFVVIAEDTEPTLDSTGGTSFAAPSILRLAAGVRAHLGSSLNLLAIRTLLIHGAEESDYPREEVGWGRVVRDIEDLVVCDDDTIRVVYQGTIKPAKYVRARVPLPAGVVDGMVRMKATLCYKSLTDPHHPGNYTRAGLEVSFRPHDQRFKRSGQLHPDTRPFFGTSNLGMTEDELRRDAWKWENSLNAAHGLRGSSLRNPCFDIHYNARLEGRNFAPEESLQYALVITVQAKSTPDFYNDVVRAYGTVLEPLRPAIEIPVRLGA